jgi:hypothetical protein
VAVGIENSVIVWAVAGSDHDPNNEVIPSEIRKANRGIFFIYTNISARQKQLK